MNQIHGQHVFADPYENAIVVEYLIETYDEVTGQVSKIDIVEGLYLP